jgi:hypothetical protein
MPWHIENNNPDCSGFAVVKDMGKVVAGCHRTEQQAKDHMAALYAAEADMNRQMDVMGQEIAPAAEEMNPAETALNDRQRAQYEAVEAMVELYGQYDQTSKANGAHYATPSPFGAEGLICANCVFYEGGQVCEVVAGQIDPNAICKMWIIPENLIQSPRTRLAEVQLLLAEYKNSHP